MTAAFAPALFFGCCVALAGCGPDDDREGDAPSPSGAVAPSPSGVGGRDASARLGMVTLRVDGAYFTDCSDGTSRPIDATAAHDEVVAAYRDNPGSGAEPLLVSVWVRTDGGAVGDGPPAPLTVERVDGVFPGEGCDRVPVDVPLERTEWVLVDLGSEPSPVAGFEPTLTLDAERGVVRGETGCGSFSGSYALAGGRLTLGVTAAPPDACPDDRAAVRRAYLEALRVTGSFDLSGGALRLLGEGGAVATYRPS